MTDITVPGGLESIRGAIDKFMNLWATAKPAALPAATVASGVVAASSAYKLLLVETEHARSMFSLFEKAISVINDTEKRLGRPLCVMRLVTAIQRDMRSLLNFFSPETFATAARQLDPEWYREQLQYSVNLMGVALGLIQYRVVRVLRVLDGMASLSAKESEAQLQALLGSLPDCGTREQEAKEIESDAKKDEEGKNSGVSYWTNWFNKTQCDNRVTQCALVTATAIGKYASWLPVVGSYASHVGDIDRKRINSGRLITETVLLKEIAHQFETYLTELKAELKPLGIDRKLCGILTAEAFLKTLQEMLAANFNWDSYSNRLQSAAWADWYRKQLQMYADMADAILNALGLQVLQIVSIISKTRQLPTSKQKQALKEAVERICPTGTS